MALWPGGLHAELPRWFYEDGAMRDRPTPTTYQRAGDLPRLGRYTSARSGRVRRGSGLQRPLVGGSAYLSRIDRINVHNDVPHGQEGILLLIICILCMIVLLRVLWPIIWLRNHV